MQKQDLGARIEPNLTGDVRGIVRKRVVLLPMFDSWHMVSQRIVHVGERQQGSRQCSHSKEGKSGKRYGMLPDDS